jgi:hypothetical protein
MVSFRFSVFSFRRGATLPLETENFPLPAGQPTSLSYPCPSALSVVRSVRRIVRRAPDPSAAVQGVPESWEGVLIPRNV